MGNLARSIRGRILLIIRSAAVTALPVIESVESLKSKFPSRSPAEYKKQGLQQGQQIELQYVVVAIVFFSSSNLSSSSETFSLIDESNGLTMKKDKKERNRDRVRIDFIFSIVEKARQAMLLIQHPQEPQVQRTL